MWQRYMLSVVTVHLVCRHSTPSLWQQYVLFAATVHVLLWQRYMLFVATVHLACGNNIHCLWRRYMLCVATAHLVCGNSTPCLWQQYMLSVATIHVVRGNIEAPAAAPVGSRGRQSGAHNDVLHSAAESNQAPGMMCCALSYIYCPILSSAVNGKNTATAAASCCRQSGA